MEQPRRADTPSDRLTMTRRGLLISAEIVDHLLFPAFLVLAEIARAPRCNGGLANVFRHSAWTSRQRFGSGTSIVTRCQSLGARPALVCTVQFDGQYGRPQPSRPSWNRTGRGAPPLGSPIGARDPSVLVAFVGLCDMRIVTATTTDGDRRPLTARRRRRIADVSIRSFVLE